MRSGVEATGMPARSGLKQCRPIPGGGESDRKRGAGWARGCRGITDRIWRTGRVGREKAELMFAVKHECGLIGKVARCLSQTSAELCLLCFRYYFKWWVHTYA